MAKIFGFTSYYTQHAVFASPLSTFFVVSSCCSCSSLLVFVILILVLLFFLPFSFSASSKAVYVDLVDR